ncbi:MAG: class I SAM-dependent methyltransferase [Candidatus Eisenbacteria bacterium]|nr:class I SAM-dependent methyltransferase [Candidatus Eisenbacteria bacterium]
MSHFPDKLILRARAGGIEATPETRNRLRAYRDMLREKGGMLSLLSAADLADTGGITRHLEDAVDALLFADPETGARVVDFGAGGGIVGIAWAILRPDMSVALLESKHKKARFLAAATEAIGLANARAVEGRGDAPDLAGAFDLVASRGVPTDRRALAAQSRLLRPGGLLLLFKGPESAPAARLVIGRSKTFELREEKSHSLGDGKERIFLLAEKI